MPQNNSINIEKLKSLCDFDGKEYKSKKGAEYIKALSQVFKLKNGNDKPFSIEEIKKQPELSHFNFIGVRDFKAICKMKAIPMRIVNEKRINEKIIVFDFVNDSAERIFNQSLGVVYIITCAISGKEYIIKIGSSRTTFKARLGSYNCGTVNNWRTASTTNIKILQSFMATREIFNLYIYDCGAPIAHTWHGIKSVPFASSLQLAVEDILVKKFIEQFKHKPLANIQANATEV
jgi:hypothetical protein